MYSWLTDSLDNHGTVVTANRRLTRALQQHYSVAQHRRGHKAWETPRIYAWTDWLDVMLEQSRAPTSLPTRISVQQSQWLWEQSLRRELPENTDGFVNLVRLSRDAWQKLADWQVGITELAGSSLNADQRHYASAAGRYQAMLIKHHWVDDAGLAPQVLSLLKDGRINATAPLTLAGFDRIRPIVSAVVQSLAAQGATVRVIKSDAGKGESCRAQVHVYEDPEKEMRAAGRWARQQISANPKARLAIIAADLDSDSDNMTRWVREGATPGWQYADASHRAAVNVSFGCTLAEYPAIEIALKCLRWSIEDISAADVSLLLRSASTASADHSVRARLELRLRDLPDRPWSPAMVNTLLKTGSDDEECQWCTILAEVSKRRRELPKLATPSQWAIQFDDILKVWGWPGVGTLSSAEFQVINRWREVLNELARLGLVSAQMSAGVALARLRLLANDTIHQAESENAVIHLMGPLEAAGMEFDQLWLSGMTSNNWPPVASPLALVSRRLQEKHGMPDATPDDTAGYARDIVARLMRSAESIDCSFSATVDDSEQTLTELIADYASETSVMAREPQSDPGWHAYELLERAHRVRIDDAVPAIGPGERIAGGAGIIQRQISEPASAFIAGRLHARPLYPQAKGVPAPTRGTIIHDALQRLYVTLPTTAALQDWGEDELSQRILAAIDAAFARHERQAGAVLLRVFKFERDRVASLLDSVVRLDRASEAVGIAGVEGEFAYAFGEVQLRLRYDRIDQFDDGTIAIIDYKTGMEKQLLSRSLDIQEIQLFVYALASPASVAALALMNIDSRDIRYSGAGRGYPGAEHWQELLDNAQDVIEGACKDLAAGDVRINSEQGAKSARALNVLTRYTELRRERN